MTTVQVSFKEIFPYCPSDHSVITWKVRGNFIRTLAGIKEISPYCPGNSLIRQEVRNY